MKKVNVANLNIEIDTADKHFLNCRCQEYLNDNFMKPDMTLQTRYVEEIRIPPGEIIEQIKINATTIMQLRENRYCRYLRSQKTEEIFFAIYYDDIYSEVEIHLSKNYPKPELLRDYEYLYSGAAFRDRLTELGGAVLHGSAIAYNKQGIIFSANCGTGKSTHTGLWKERFDSKVTIVNDDKPALRFYEGIPFMFGTPWSGKTDLNTNEQVQLKSIVFIKQAEMNRIERLNPRESIFSLMSQIARPFYNERLGLKTMEMIEKLVQTVPIYRLHCTISQEAVDIVYQQLLQERVINA